MILYTYLSIHVNIGHMEISSQSNKQRTWLSVAKIHLYFTTTPRDKWGVFSYVILAAESDSGLQIRILPIFDPQNPLFGSKIDPVSKNFLSTSLVCMWHLFLKLIKCTLPIHIWFLQNIHLSAPKMTILGPKRPLNRSFFDLS